MTRRTPLSLLLALTAAACITTSSPDDTSAATSPETVDVGVVESATTSPADTNPETTTTTTTRALDENFSMQFLVRVDEAFPHDSGSFTQGLVFRDGLFYESSGRYGESRLRIIDPHTGEVVSEVALGDEYFAEGLEVVGGRIVQLTWREETAFIWDAYTLEPLGTYDYQGEGWGLCARDGHFVMSNGSSQLAIRDLDTFEVVDRITVRFRGEPVENLNELECSRSWIYANVWQSDTIMVIDPGSGFVIARIDGSVLAGQLSSTDGIDMLNGIAYDASTDTYYLTGKLWPEVFKVKLVPSG